MAWSQGYIWKEARRDGKGIIGLEDKGMGDVNC